LLLASLLVPAASGLWAAGLLALCPLFFAQSSLAHLDVAATAATLFTIYYYLRGRITSYLIAATVLCMTRETGAVLVILLAVLARNPAMLAPLLPLAGWFGFLRFATGRWLGDPTFVAYNLWTTLNPLRLMLSLMRRIHFLFLVDFRWTLAIPALWVFWKSRRVPDFPRGRAGYELLWMVVAAQLLVMSALGGALLDRYLLPALAAFYLLALEALERLKVKHRQWALFTLLMGQIVCFFWNPPYPFPLEENMAYADFVNLHATAADRVHQLPAGARILTAWPAAAEFQHPELGYVDAPIMTKIVALEDFSEQSFSTIRREDFDAVFMFSLEWRPEFDLLEIIPELESLRRSLYNRRPQVPPEWVRVKYKLLSRGRINLRGQWVEWLEPDPRWPARPEAPARPERVSFSDHPAARRGDFNAVSTGAWPTPQISEIKVAGR
jgi:hypothetical protein